VFAGLSLGHIWEAHNDADNYLKALEPLLDANDPEDALEYQKAVEVKNKLYRQLVGLGAIKPRPIFKSPPPAQVNRGSSNATLTGLWKKPVDKLRPVRNSSLDPFFGSSQDPINVEDGVEHGTLDYAGIPKSLQLKQHCNSTDPTPQLAQLLTAALKSKAGFDVFTKDQEDAELVKKSFENFFPMIGACGDSEALVNELSTSMTRAVTFQIEDAASGSQLYKSKPPSITGIKDVLQCIQSLHNHVFKVLSSTSPLHAPMIRYTNVVHRRLVAVQAASVGMGAYAKAALDEAVAASWRSACERSSFPMPLVTIDSLVKSCLKAVDDLEGRLVKLEEAEKARAERERNASQQRVQQQQFPNPPGTGRRAKKKANKSAVAFPQNAQNKQSSSSSAQGA
jgi:hypothetical protein